MYTTPVTPPPHPVGKVLLIRCDSAFLPPRSSGAGAGKEDLQEALRQVKQTREEAKSGEEGESSRENLMPKTKRVKVEDGSNERKDLMQSMQALISTKVDKASSDSSLTKMNMLNKQLETYFALAGNSETPADIRANFWDMIHSTQAQITLLQNSMTVANQVQLRLTTPRRSTASSSGTSSPSTMNPSRRFHSSGLILLIVQQLRPGQHPPRLGQRSAEQRRLCSRGLVGPGRRRLVHISPDSRRRETGTERNHFLFGNVKRMSVWSESISKLVFIECSVHVHE